MAAIIKTVIYRSKSGSSRPRSIQVAKVVGEQPIASNTSLTWRPEAFEVPNVETTSESCSLITVTYALEVLACGCDATINMPIVLGNIPLDA